MNTYSLVGYSGFLTADTYSVVPPEISHIETASIFSRRLSLRVSLSNIG